MITWWVKLGGYLPPGHNALLFFNKWHGILHIPSRTDTAGHTKAFIYLVIDHWGESQSALAYGRPPTCWSTVEHAIHQTAMTPITGGGVVCDNRRATCKPTPGGGAC